MHALRLKVRFISLICMLFITFQCIAKEKVCNSTWCFTLSKSSKVFAVQEIQDFNVRYLDKKTNKWKKVIQSMCGWGYQPDFSLERCYQFVAPSNLKAFEITLFDKRKSVKVLIDQISDTLSKHKLIGFKELVISQKNNQFEYKELPKAFVGEYVCQELKSIVQYYKGPRIKSNQETYLKNASIKIYIEADSLEEQVVLYGCGTPGTLYKVQQWINGDWMDYQNNWGLKCAQEKFVINRYIVGLTIDRIGVFRIVFDKPSVNNESGQRLISNPFQVVGE